MHSGIDRTHMDDAVRPQDDLFAHVNGAWLASAQIPKDRARYGAFDLLRENAESDVRALIETAAEQQPALDTAAGKVGALYASFMDTDRVDALGIDPLVEPLRAVAAVATPSDVVRLSGHLQREGLAGLVNIFVTADAGSPQDYILYLHQGGLGLPDEDYYTAQTHDAVREAYRAYLGTLLELGAPALEAAGLDLGRDPVGRLYALEEQIADAHWDRVATRDAVKSYTRLAHDELAAQLPGWDWAALAEGLGAPEGAFDHVVARQPDVLAAVGVALTEVPVQDWQVWLAVRILDGLAPYLTEDLVTAHFDFHGTTLSGTPANKERWKRGVALVEALLGEAAGQMYVEAHFPPAARARMGELVTNVIAAFRQRIAELEWMGQETRAKALDKLAAFRPKIGHPPTFRDYTAYQLDAADLVGNIRRGAAFETDRELAKIGGPIDRDEWLMTPQTVNAYYHPMLNEIVFPAAMLQPPFFDVEADDAVNYGGIGAVIAHEIGHGFDDQGSRYAGDGSLTDWWTEQDRTRFDERSQALVAQFSALTPRGLDDETKVNGGLTVGENIGDLCGLELAHLAYVIASDGAAPELDGWSAAQRFFLGWSSVWRGKAREQEARRLLAIDPHAPADLRANTVRNVDAFHEAFETAEGDALWLAPEDRVRIF
ncbi:MAG: M13-type metalloendopeptidase [Ornithinimicrobium sp.]|uniref:M13 family metallopeptidase n=1 Tax=Ornithinimicrobium sp. TaxID=1977084 RepID=UPI0026DF81C9|nr:M13-type metalloendopeptidase [Ornithinimicrobium sp.]MDO5739629.1 M13-type metalloendopeptidase [Ornithinimicrobium sp.]